MLREAGLAEALVTVRQKTSKDASGSEPPPPPPAGAQDPAARRRVERLAMEAVMAAERALDRDVKDVSSENCGWDVESYPRAGDGPWRFIEVKGRVKGAKTVTVTSNEIHMALNKGEPFLLAIVLVDGDEVEGPYYVRQPFTQEPEPFATSIQYDLDTLLGMAKSAGEV
jgi:hypothetical protein